MVPSGYVDVICQPTIGVLCPDEINLIVLNQHAYGFLNGREGFLVVIHQTFYTYIYYRTLTLLLKIVNPTDDGNNAVHERTVVHAVLTVEVECIGVDFVKHVEGVDCGVFVAKESVDTLTVFVRNAFEAMFRLVFVFLDQCLVHVEFLNAIQTRVLELLCTCHTVRLHCLAHL